MIDWSNETRPDPCLPFGVVALLVVLVSGAAMVGAALGLW